MAGALFQPPYFYKHFLSAFGLLRFTYEVNQYLDEIGYLCYY